MKECCATCGFCLRIRKLDYSKGGCEHTDVDGYACLLFEHEGICEWMFGENQETGMCEGWIGRKNAATRRWISVTRRLPPDNKKVLVYTPVDGEVQVAWHINPGRKGQHEWRIIAGMKGFQALTKKVTHWMALPEMPKEV